jgi:inner membrane protein
MSTKNPFKDEGKSISLKLLTISIMLIVFLVISILVQNLIRERSDRQSETIQEVNSKWGQNQTIIGPILTIPYITPENDTKYAFFNPDTLTVNGKIKSEIKSRGIYNVPLYESDMKFDGQFSQPTFDKSGINYKSILWDKSFISIGITDLHGITTTKLAITWNGEIKEMDSKIKPEELKQGIGTTVLIDAQNPKNYTFTFDLKLRGSQKLYFTPVGKNTSVNLTSDWKYPSFDGNSLPINHEITNNGFTASWNVPNLNGSFSSEKYYENSDSINNDSFGVNFYLPVDMYQETERSAKYAMAIISLMFLVLFLIETISKRRIHPIQYTLIGLALVIFYTLLLSLTEYIGFGYAYLIASISISTMVGLFSNSVMKSKSLGFMSGGVVTALYGFIYILLQMQNYTLLVGSISLFIILAIFMYVTRKINWYGEKNVN